METRVIKKLNELSGNWFIASVVNVEYRTEKHQVYNRALFVKLVDYYDLKYAPFDKGSIAWKEESNNAQSAYFLFPAKSTCSLFPGLVFKNGRPLRKNEHTYIPDKRIEIKLKGEKNYAHSLEEHASFLPSWTSVPEVFKGTSYIKLDTSHFEECDTQWGKVTKVYIPSFEIFRHLYLRTSRLAAYFLDNSFRMKNILVNWGNEFEQRIYKVHSKLNYKPIEFDTFASILSNPQQRRHFDWTRDQIFNDYYYSDKKSSFISYIPPAVKTLRCVGLPIPGIKKGTISLLCYHIDKSIIDYRYNKLEFISDQDGRSTPNKKEVKEYIDKVKRYYQLRAKENKNQLPADHESEFASGSLPVLEQEFLDDIQFPPSIRLERDDQKSIVNTIGIPEQGNDSTLTSNIQSGTDPGLPRRLEQELQKVKEKKQKELKAEVIVYINLFYELQEHLAEFFNVQLITNISNDFSSKDFEDTFRAQYLKDYNSLSSLPNFNARQRNFCQYYRKEKTKSDWSGHRGIAILKVSLGKKSLYFFELEPRIKENSWGGFFLLCVYSSDIIPLSSQKILEITQLAGKCEGVWKKVKEDSTFKGLQTSLVKHDMASFVHTILTKCKTLFKLK